MRAFLMSIVILAFNIINCNSSELPKKVTWQTAGPGGGGGMFSPAVSPHDDNLMFVSCDMSGVYRTTNGGENWEMIDYRQLKSSIRCAPVFHPTDENIMWDEMGSSIMQSTDKGKTWEKATELDEAPLDMICVMDNGKAKLIMACPNDELFNFNGNLWPSEGVSNIQFLDESGYIIAASSEQAYCSVNNGSTYFPIDSPDGLQDIIDVAIDSGNVYILESKKLWQSTDLGGTWSEIASSEKYDRGDFKFVRVYEDKIWITTSGGGMYQSSALLSKDFGVAFEPVFFCNNSWDETSNLENSWLDLDFNCGWGGSAIGFCIAPGNPDIAVWTDYGRTLSTRDCGETWQSIFTEHVGAGEPASGDTWASRGLEVTTSWDCFQSDDFPGFVHVAYTDIGGSYSSDDGATWRSTFDGGIPNEWRNTTYDFEYDSENQKLYGAFSGRHDIPSGWSANNWNNQGTGGIAISDNGGMSWQVLTSDSDINKPVTSISLGGGDDDNLYAAVWSDGIWRSTDNGQTWERKSEGLDCGSGECTNDGPNAHIVEVRAHPDGTLFALKTKYIRNGSKIKNDGGLWKSTDKGESWISISANVADCLPNSSIDLDGEHSWADPISFLPDEENSDHIFVCAQNCNNGKVQGGLYETTDGGENWMRIHQIYGAHRLTKSKYFENRYYLATIGEGILVSNDGCQTWEDFFEFPFAHTTRISEDIADSSIIWVNTYGGGVWKGKMDFGGTGINETPEAPNGMSVYPNPFNSDLNISSPGAELVEIFDMQGRKKGRFNGGEYKISTEHFLPGAYIVRAVKNRNYYTKIVIHQK